MKDFFFEKMRLVEKRRIPILPTTTGPFTDLITSAIVYIVQSLFVTNQGESVRIQTNLEVKLNCPYTQRVYAKLTTLFLQMLPAFFNLDVEEAYLRPRNRHEYYLNYVCNVAIAGFFVMYPSLLSVKDGIIYTERLPYWLKRRIRSVIVYETETEMSIVTYFVDYNEDMNFMREKIDYLIKASFGEFV